MLRFDVVYNTCQQHYGVIDYDLEEYFLITPERLMSHWFDINTWFECEMMRYVRASVEIHHPYYLLVGIPRLFGDEDPEGKRERESTVGCSINLDNDSDSSNSLYSLYDNTDRQWFISDKGESNKVVVLYFGGTYHDDSPEPALQCNAAIMKDTARIVPKLITIVVNVNGHPACTLIDTGLLCDFLSTSLADQLKLKKDTLETPLKVQLAVQGLHSMVNHKTTVKLTYQGINEDCTFDIMNVSNHDIILGTPFLYQH